MTKDDLQKEYEIETGELAWSYNTQYYSGEYVNWLEDRIVKSNIVLATVRHCDTSKLSELFCDNKEKYKCECVGHCGNYA